MDINLILRIAGIGLLITLLTSVLKQVGKDEHALLVTLAGVVIVTLMVIQLIERLFSDVRAVFGL
ncbi:stage III sporulation protein AC [Hydrogenispora ethanolica]|uniref:Stage III sporulation protein AC n=1 Tax=Hydrogenispora ethanolica TaxID=1082276 RepID=A0A4R1RVV6_HYDET|nr:stage III sporulation protein AC [Hydrogenispora ethanolica]TCL70791.1 stage III sporulation protein AC [Hydrogenispora ethanolica]